MSTILDALRKVEEANRMKNTDVRTRLLTGVSRFDLRRPRNQRISWFIVVGLILVGIIVGSGVRGWKGQHPSGVEPSGVGETPAASQVTEQQRPQVMAKAPAPPDSKPAPTSQIAPADRPPPRIAETPFYPDPASTKAARPVPPPLPLPPPTTAEPPVPRASAPTSVAKVAPADRPPPRIAETPFYPDPASGAPARPIPPVPVVPQAETASAPVVAARSRRPSDKEREAPSNFPGARFSGEEREAVRNSFAQREAVRDELSANPVQRSPFVNTAEPERIAPPPPSPPVERRVAAKAKPSPAPQAPAPPETATDSPVDPTPAPLEEDAAAEATPPPTPATVSFLQWSPEPEKRMAFIKIGDAPTTLAHEGDTVNGVTVVKIRQGAVDLRSGDSRWTLRAR
jgi:hypothetical protein